MIVDIKYYFLIFVLKKKTIIIISKLSLYKVNFTDYLLRADIKTLFFHRSKALMETGCSHSMQLFTYDNIMISDSSLYQIYAPDPHKRTSVRYPKMFPDI